MRPLIVSVKGWPARDYISAWSVRTGFARKTLRAAILRGALPAERIGAHYIVSKTALLAWGNGKGARHAKT